MLSTYGFLGQRWPSSEQSFADHANRSNRHFLSGCPRGYTSSDTSATLMTDSRGLTQHTVTPAAYQNTPQRLVPGPPSARKGLSSEALSAERRRRYLDHTRKAGRDKRWETREQDLARLDREAWLNERRAWESSLGMEAPPDIEEDGGEDDFMQQGLSDDVLSKETGAPINPSSANVRPVQDDAQVEEVTRLEDQDIEALLEMMDAGPTMDAEMHERGGDGEEVMGSSVFGSDDEEYEKLFSEIAWREARQGPDFDARQGRTGRGAGGHGNDSGCEEDVTMDLGA